MTQYKIYGAGTTLNVESYHPEVAEAEVVERYGVKVENLVTVEIKDELLSGNCVADSAERDRRNYDPE